MGKDDDRELTPDELDAKFIDDEAAYLDEKVGAQQAQFDKERAQASLRKMDLNRVAGDLPDSPFALWSYVEHSLTQSAVSMIDAGRGLIKLKEILPYGEFRADLEDRGIPKSTANDMMRVAFRMSDRSEKFLKLGRTKLYACLDFTDDELDALEDGKSVLDMDLDAIDRMTTRDFREVLKKKDAEIEAVQRERQDVEKLSADKNVQMDEISRENLRLCGNSMPWDERIAPLKNEMNLISNTLDEALGSMMIIHKNILNIDLKDDDMDMATRSLVARYSEVLSRAAMLVAECQGQFDLELGGYIGAMRDYLMQVPGEDLQTQTGDEPPQRHPVGPRSVQ